MSSQNTEALRRNYDATKAERDSLAKAYEKNGCMTAGIPNLQQFDWKLERLAKELADVGIIVGGERVDASRVENTVHAPAAQAAPEVQRRPVARVRRAVQRQSEG